MEERWWFLAGENWALVRTCEMGVLTSVNIRTSFRKDGNPLGMLSDVVRNGSKYQLRRSLKIEK